MTRFLFPLAAILLLSGKLVAAQFTFEDLGEPLRVRSIVLEHVTGDSDRGFMAWGQHESSDKRALIGVRLKTGQITWVDLTHLGMAHIQSTKAANGNIYIYAGSPGHFLKYDVAGNKLIDLGIPTNPASYNVGSTVGPDGKFYVGTFPKTTLVQCDPATGKVKNFDRTSPDARQCYLLSPVASRNNIIYCPVGLHHRELWAVSPATGVKTQILPASMTHDQGIPTVWQAEDGEVYGRAGRVSFRCLPDRIEIGKTKPAKRASPLLAGHDIVNGIDGSGSLVLSNVKTGKKNRIPTSYEGSPKGVYSVGCERDGKIYGGTVFPATSFSFDVATGKITNLGQLSTAPIQVYDSLNHPLGVFLSSYMPASVDFYDPAKKQESPLNPRPVVSVSGQERPVQLALGPDGMIYTGTFPSKGRLGGALVRIDPTNFSHQAWVNVVSNQSIYSVVGVPETGELLCTTSVNGGSSSIPTEKAACVVLWDCRRERVAFSAKPIPGAKSYGTAVQARNGIIYGVAGNRYYAFEPKSRKTVFTGVLPVKALHFPELSDEPAGPHGLIYGLGDDAIFTIDPADHSTKILARDKSLRRAQGFYVTSDQTLYYGSGSRLMRCRLGH